MVLKIISKIIISPEQGEGGHRINLHQKAKIFLGGRREVLIDDLLF
jgi:hypothetical protein